MTPCEKCTKCIDSAQGVVAGHAPAATAADIVDSVVIWCAEADRNSTVCSTLQTAVRDSYLGNLGRRAGAICSRLGECSGPAIADTSCTVSIGGSSLPAAAVDACSVQGIAGGSPVDGIYTGTGA